MAPYVHVPAGRLPALAPALALALASCTLLERGGGGGGYVRGGLDPVISVERTVLPNGLVLLVVENPRLPVFSYYTLYDVGGRHEREGTTGATHFLEHMMFKGSRNYGPGVFDGTIEGRGGSTNAYTTFDSTVYYENLPKESLAEIVSMEADRMEDLLLVPESVDRERNVIFEERKMRYENSPSGKLYLGMMQAVFEGTPYGGSVIGEVADLRRLTPDNLRHFHDLFYAPNNAIVVVAGDVDASEVRRLVGDRMGPLEPSEGLAALKAGQDAPGAFAHRGRYGRDVRLSGANPLPMFSMAFKGTALGTRRGFVLDILASILGDGESSWFSRRLVKGARPLLSSVSAANYTLRHNGVFFITGHLKEGATLRAVKARLLREIRDVCGKAVTPRSVQKTKNQYLVRQFQEIQTNAGVAEFLGLRELYFGDYEFYKKELEIYRSIQPEETRRECEELFRGGEQIFVSVSNDA